LNEPKTKSADLFAESARNWSRIHLRHRGA
jgi:hypothetical protein